MNTKKIAEGVCGLLIAAGGAAAWHFWGVDGFLAMILAFIGLGMVGDAFGYKIW